jgi:hydrogenase maturation protein HypF
MAEIDAGARRIVLRGRVQGVGFRPFVHRLAAQLALTGRVWNGSGRVTIEAAGSAAALCELEQRLIDDAPPLARPELMSSAAIAGCGWQSFEIAESIDEAPDVAVPPDVALCGDCRRELDDEADRRHRYPFINCTQCGPRFTIIDGLPYDRARTSMAGFAMCSDCRAEYADPASRRFHAEPIACPACGPVLSFEDASGVSAGSAAALARAAAVIAAGGVVALKGLGGYHLVCDATRDDAIARLRAQKRRPSKPLAVMIAERGIDGLDAVRAEVLVSPVLAAALTGPERPIVLAPRRRDGSVSPAVAPGLDEVGVLLPYAPLHALLLAEVGAPLVVTSGNPSGEPLAIDEPEARAQLAGVADAWVHSDRPILRRADDSVVRELAGVARPLRLGRGLSPLELRLPRAFAEPMLAVGGHQKNAVAIGWAGRVVLSPHVGDLDSAAALSAFTDRIDEMKALYRISPTRVVCDAHPDYASTRWARDSGLAVTPVLHHHAHASAAVGEAGWRQPHLVFTWDGVGLGDDGTAWGGEAFYGAPGAWQRVASVRPFRIPGALRAGREPWRSRAALCWELGRDAELPLPGLALARQAWARGVGCQITSAVGRLFDAAASFILGLETYGHEAQGPAELEALARAGRGRDLGLPLADGPGGLVWIDWEPLIEMLADGGLDKAERAATLHQSLIGAAVRVALCVRAQRGACPVAFGGGVFQNRILCDGLMARLHALGVQVVLPSQVPLGDGGLAYGQLLEVLGGSP